MNLSIEPLSERHFGGVYAALDMVAREKRYLAFTQAPPIEQAFEFYRYILANDLCQMLALMDGLVVGWCDVLPARGEARAHIGTLGIGLVPPARHMGIGPKLMQQAIDAAWARGLTRIELTVKADNAKAKALYQRFGFEVEGLLRNSFRVDGEYSDSYAMALLRPGETP